MSNVGRAEGRRISNKEQGTPKVEPGATASRAFSHAENANRRRISGKVSKAELLPAPLLHYFLFPVPCSIFNPPSLSLWRAKERALVKTGARQGVFQNI
jgi:hypothetical protein